MSSGESLNVLHLTDAHLHADPATTLYGIPTDRSFRAVLDCAFGDEHWHADVVLATGDLVEDGSAEGYARFRSFMQDCGLPVLSLPGNHDEPGVMARALDTAPFSFCAIHDIDPWRFIMLNSHIPGDEGGLLSESELGRLDDALGNAGDRHVLVCVHHQPIPMGSAWLDGYGLRNSAEFLDCLQHHPGVRGVVWGHVHQASDRERDGMRWLSSPSTCAQFTPGTEKCVMDVRPPGFRRLGLSADGNIDTEVVWLDDWTVDERPPDSRQNA